jgi:hypothetical protein
LQYTLSLNQWGSARVESVKVQEIEGDRAAGRERDTSEEDEA